MTCFRVVFVEMFHWLGTGKKEHGHLTITRYDWNPRLVQGISIMLRGCSFDKLPLPSLVRITGMKRKYCVINGTETSSEGGLESHLEMSTPTYMVQSHLFIQNPSPTSRGVPPNIWYTLESHLIKSKFPFSCYKMTITDEQTGMPPLAQATLQIKWNEKL